MNSIERFNDQPDNIRSIRPEESADELPPLPDVVLQEILEHEARQEEWIKRGIEHASRLQRTRAFARMITRLSKN